MTFVLLGSYAPSLINFRGPLIAALVRRGQRVVAMAPAIDAETRASLEALGAEAQEVPLSRTGMNPFADLANARSLERTLRRLNAETLLTYTAKPVIWGSIAGRRAGVPRIAAMITGLGFAFIDGDGVRRRIAGTAVKQLYAYALRRCDHVFFQNPDDLAAFHALGLLAPGAETSLINGSGVDIRHYARCDLPVAPVFLMIARLLGDKGVREYAEAASMIRRRHPGVVIRLVGPMDTSPNAIAQSELDAWIAGGLEYLGALKDIRPALSAANVYVLPSYREGTPRTVLEAMSMGRAIITTDAPGCRETVTDGINGFLVPARDASALADAMERFLQHPELIGRMGAESRRCVEARYDVDLVNAAILDRLGMPRRPLP